MRTVFPTDRILESFPASPLVGGADAGATGAAVDAAAVCRAVGGSDIGPGLYRIHTPESAAEADELVRTAFPDVPEFFVFGMDWLGRQFAALGSAPDAEVAMFELASGEAVALPVAFADFHAVALTEDPDQFVARAAFEQWVGSGHAAPEPYQCVGYVIPLFLGGAEEFANFKVADWRVYWSVIGQALAQVDRLPEGTPISGLQIGF